MKTTLSTLALAATLLTNTANAGSIQPVTGSTSAPLAYPGAWNSVSNVIDGFANYNSELVLGYEGMAGFTGPYSVEFDLGRNFDLTGMTLWNNAGYIGNDGEGINGFQLRFLDLSKSVLGSFSGNANDSLNPQAFAFSADGVRFVDLVITSNHNPARGYVALYEVNFSGVPSVPEPETYALMLAGLGLVGFAVRRRAI
jgi:hypothetical protein